MYSFYAFHYTKQSLKISEQTNKSLLRKKCSKCQIFNFEKNDFKVKN